MKKTATNRIVMLSILGAWAFLMRLLDFPILPSASFLKFDVSDLVALVGMWLYGPFGLFIVAFIRDLINYLIKGGQLGIPIGGLMSLTASLAMFLPIHFYYKKRGINYRTKDVLITSIILIVMLTVSMSFFNYFIALPWYVAVMQFPITDFGMFVKTIIVPFNLIKGGILSILIVILLKVILPIIQKRGNLYYSSDNNV